MTANHADAARLSRRRSRWRLVRHRGHRRSRRQRRRRRRGRTPPDLLCPRRRRKRRHRGHPGNVRIRGPVGGVLAGGEHRRSAAIRSAIHEAFQQGLITAEAPGVVHGGVALVGGGPGDPELITVRGRRLLANADVVVADRLAPPELLAELPPHVEVIDAAKIPYGRAMAQDAINAVLIERARERQVRRPAQGRRPVRLRPGLRRGDRLHRGRHPGHRGTGCDKRHSGSCAGGRSCHSSGRDPRVRGGQRPRCARAPRIVSELGCAGRDVRHDRLADGCRAHRIVRRRRC